MKEMRFSRQRVQHTLCLRAHSAPGTVTFSLQLTGAARRRMRRAVPYAAVPWHSSPSAGPPLDGFRWWAPALLQRPRARGGDEPTTQTRRATTANVCQPVDGLAQTGWHRTEHRWICRRYHAQLMLVSTKGWILPSGWQKLEVTSLPPAP